MGAALTAVQPAPSARIAGAGARATVLSYLHACPICGGRSTAHYCRAPSLTEPDEYIVYERCRTCQVVFRNPRLPDQERLERYVERPINPAAVAHDPVSIAHCHHMAKRLQRLCPPGSRRRLLDFGCGTGGFLLEARAAGFDVTGLEVMASAARFVTSTYGIPVFTGVITSPEFAGARFDIIVSRQVFEHLTDPKGTLTALRSHLDRPGLLLIEVPNLRHIQERLRRGSTMDDSHLFYFGRQSLSRLLEGCGFRILHVAEGLRPFRFVRDGRRLPPFVVDVCERVMSLWQLKTGLSIVAALR
jgi:SAM-dependent methyltransferase